MSSVHFHLDCFSGVAGDMMLAACLDASSDPSRLLQHITQSLQQGLPAIANEFSIDKQRVHRGQMSCIAATYVTVRHLSPQTGKEVADQPAPVPSASNGATTKSAVGVVDHDGHDHSHSHEHAHEHSHSHGHDHNGHKEDSPTASPPTISPLPPSTRTEESSSSNHAHSHEHDSSHSHSHNHTSNENNNNNNNSHSITASSPLRNWKDIRQMLQDADPVHLPPWVRDMALSTFFELAKAEAFVHGATDPDAVHFHEVGSIDSIVDTVGSLLAMYALAQEQQQVQSTTTSSTVAPNITCSCSPIPMGEGTCFGMHGLMPVPAFATMRLLLGMPTCPGPVGVTGELVTPTGAALVRALTTSMALSSFDGKDTDTDTDTSSSAAATSKKKSVVGRPPHGFVPRAIGHGAGTKDFVKHANVLRILVGTI